MRSDKVWPHCEVCHTLLDRDIMLDEWFCLRCRIKERFDKLRSDALEDKNENDD